MGLSEDRQSAIAGGHALLAAAAVKTLEEFDFSFQPSIKREQIDSLAVLHFLERRESVVLLGTPVVAETHSLLPWPSLLLRVAAFTSAPSHRARAGR